MMLSNMWFSINKTLRVLIFWSHSVICYYSYCSIQDVTAITGAKITSFLTSRTQTETTLHEHYVNVNHVGFTVCNSIKN